MKKRIAIVRGKFLNKYEMQFFEPLVEEFDITAFGSLRPYHESFAFPVIKLLSPMDLPEFPYKMPILNRIFVDAHYLLGLVEHLRGFDLVHSAETYFHCTRQCIQARDKGYVQKVIATVLDNIPYNNEGIIGRSQFKADARKKLDHIVALTKLTRQALVSEGADANKISIISHYINTKKFTPSTPMNKTFKTLTILFSGRLEDYKGIFDLLDAFKILIDQKLPQKLKLLIVGAGSRRNAVIQKAHKLGIFPLLELNSIEYDMMPDIYRQSDIFVAPSKPTATWAEQYCTVLLEAQASGLPIVTTRCGGIPENIGSAGIIVPPGDVGALASALKRFIIYPQLRRKYSFMARARAIKYHDIHVGVRLLARLYHTLLS